MKTIHAIQITDDAIFVDGSRLTTTGSGSEMLTAIYKERIGSYPKYYKMDLLCRLGFVASELLLNAEGCRSFDDQGHLVQGDLREDRAILLFNQHGTAATDEHYQQTIDDADDYFPSPSIFVYTLPNILAGEIAIRNRYCGETNFCVLPRKDWQLMEYAVEDAFQDEMTESAVVGWVDCDEEGHLDAELKIIVKE